MVVMAAADLHGSRRARKVGGWSRRGRSPIRCPAGRSRRACTRGRPSRCDRVCHRVQDQGLLFPHRPRAGWTPRPTGGGRLPRRAELRSMIAMRSVSPGDTRCVKRERTMRLRHGSLPQAVRCWASQRRPRSRGGGEAPARHRHPKHSMAFGLTDFSRLIFRQRSIALRCPGRVISARLGGG